MLAPDDNMGNLNFTLETSHVRDCTVLQLTAAGISFVTFMTVNVDYSNA